MKRVPCLTKKICYASKHMATKAAISLFNAGKTSYATTYLCNFCGKWHVTSKERRKIN